MLGYTCDYANKTEEIIPINRYASIKMQGVYFFLFTRFRKLAALNASWCLFAKRAPSLSPQAHTHTYTHSNNKNSNNKCFHRKNRLCLAERSFLAAPMPKWQNYSLFQPNVTWFSETWTNGARVRGPFSVTGAIQLHLFKNSVGHHFLMKNLKTKSIVTF